MPETPLSVPKTKDEVFQCLGVPHETQSLLERYAALLATANAHLNLVAPGALKDLWGRHIFDSAQLKTYLGPSVQSLADLGSGAGFPGLVLAILGVPQVYLIESVGKKARFLEETIQTLGLTNVSVQAVRAESLRMKADVITARAVTALSQLLSYAKPLMKEDSFCLFLKGQKAQAELTEARKYWTFSLQKFPSASDPSGTILMIEKLKVLRAHGSFPKSHARG